MKLTLQLLATFRRTYPGHKYRGKRHKWPEVTNRAVREKVEALKTEEQNMFYLRHPYLTLEQSWGHAGELGKPLAFGRKMYLIEMTSKGKPDVTVEERYNMLRNHDVWD